MDGCGGLLVALKFPLINGEIIMATNKKETWTRHTVITQDMVGKCYSVYNGKRFVPVTVAESDVGKTLLSVATGV